MVLLDGNNLVWRSFHAGKHLKSRGRSTAVLHIGLTMMAGLDRLVEPQPIIFLWDQGVSWRKAVLPCYKENRNRATPEYKAVREQIEIFVELLTGIGVKQARYDSFEADDLAGAYAAAALEHGNSVVLISGDKDWLQLLGPKVKQLRGWVGSKGDWWDVARMKIEHGMGVEDWPRYLSLIGDKGDNIPKALSGRRGPVVAKAIIAGEQELLPEEQAQYALNFKVIKINPTLADRKLKSTLVKPNRGEAGWQHLQDTLKEYELVQLWEDRRRIWQVGAW